LIHRYFLLLGFLAAGCTVTPKFQGEYVSRPGFINSSLKLYEDSTFIYKWSSCVARIESRGKWKIHSKYLILNSYNQPGDNVTKIKKIKDTSIKYISILVKDTGNESLVGAFAKFTINDGNIYRKGPDLDGNLICQECYNRVKEIKITYLGYDTAHIELPANEKSFNKFEVILSPSHSMIYFKDEKWRICQNKIINKGRAEKLDYALVKSDVLKKP
jgi:hypothetical protein